MACSSGFIGVYYEVHAGPFVVVLVATAMVVIWEKPILKQCHKHVYMGTAQISQTLVAHVGSATDSNHNLYAAVVCKVSSNVYDHGQIKGPDSKIKSSQECLGMRQVHSEVNRSAI
eukprot:2606350-Pleurochrysis_carterae.AAC.1